jgi:hypothetical protein
MVDIKLNEYSEATWLKNIDKIDGDDINWDDFLMDQSLSLDPKDLTINGLYIRLLEIKQPDYDKIIIDPNNAIILIDSYANDISNFANLCANNMLFRNKNLSSIAYSCIMDLYFCELEYDCISANILANDHFTIAKNWHDDWLILFKNIIDI